MCRIYLDMLVVLQKLELYGLAGATHLAALCLDNYHSLFYSFVSTVLFWFPTILIYTISWWLSRNWNNMD